MHSHRSTRTAPSPAALVTVATVIALSALLTSESHAATRRKPKPTDWGAVLKKAKALAKGNNWQASRVYEQILRSAPVESDAFGEALGGYRSLCTSKSRDTRFTAAALRWFARLGGATLEEDRRRALTATYYYELGRHEYRMGRYANAVKRLTTGLEHARDDRLRDVRRYLTFSLARSGDVVRARTLWTELLKEDPRDSELRRFAAELLFAKGSSESGLKLLEGEAYDADAMHVLEEFYRRREIAKVEPLAERMAKTNVRAKRMLAVLRESQGRHAEAAPLYEACFRAETDGSSLMWHFAWEFAQAHSRSGGLAAAVKRLRAELDAIKPAPENAPDRRCLNAGLAALHRAAGRDLDAFAAIRARRLLLEEPPSRDWRIDDYGRRALHRLVDPRPAGDLTPAQAKKRAAERARRLTEALDLLATIKKEGLCGPWISAAEFATRTHAGRRAEAAALLEEYERSVANKKDDIYWIGTEIEPWGFSDVCARIFHDVLEIEPTEDSSFQQHAHARLAKHYAENKRNWAAAREHCVAVQDHFDERHLGGMSADNYRQMEALIFYRAAGNNADVLIAFLDDSSWRRQRYAIRYLTSYAEKRHLAQMAKRLDRVPAWMRAELEGAIGRARARLASVVPKRGPVDDAAIRERLRTRGRVLWLEKDRYDKKLRWAAVAGEFVFRVDAKTGHTVDCGDALAVQGYAGLTATSIAFTPKTVWVGTDHGLFAYERWAKSWNAYSVSGHGRDVPVEKVLARGTTLEVTVRTNGKPQTARFDLAKRRWGE
jgi:ribosomal protein L39E